MSLQSRRIGRRDSLQLAVASVLGVSASGWLPRLARAAQRAKSPKSCILLWMAGGPSQLDTFDPKPQHANQGPVEAIATSVPGIQISEYLPAVAQQMTDLAIIRDMNSGEGDHQRGSQLMLTGYKPNPATVYPGLGSLLSKELRSLDNDLPSYVSLSSGSRASQVAGAGFLGPHYAPLIISGDSEDPAARANLFMENLAPPQGVTPEAMRRRFSALSFLQGEFADQFDSPAAEAHRAVSNRAVRMIESQAMNAFRLNEESTKLRDAYGRNRFGQGCLLARRMVERGVAFVEVTLSGVQGRALGWDTHAQNFAGVEGLCGVLDPAWSTLMTDLRDRGLLDSTLVIWMGEFGRTPTINGQNGRDHWTSGWSIVLGGAAVRGGQTIGDTGKDGMKLTDQPREGTKVSDLYATICSALGIDYALENVMPGGRPIGIVDGSARPIRELLI